MTSSCIEDIWSPVPDSHPLLNQTRLPSILFLKSCEFSNCCILQLSLLFCNVLVDVHVLAACPCLNKCPFPLVGSQLFARGVNLNWPIRAQSGTCSSRFQTAVDVEHGPRMVVRPYGRILFKFSTTKNGLGNLSGFMEIWFLWRLVVPHRDERTFCEVGTLRTIVRMERSDRAFHFVLREEQLRREIA